MSDPLGGPPVPGAQSFQQLARGIRLETAEPVGPEIGIALVPGIAHRREAIADMRHAGRRRNRLGNTMTEADYEVAARQTPGSHGTGHRRQEVAVVVLDAGQPLQEAGHDRPHQGGVTWSLIY